MGSIGLGGGGVRSRDSQNPEETLSKAEKTFKMVPATSVECFKMAVKSFRMPTDCYPKLRGKPWIKKSTGED